ncbi:hypothetical protein ACFSC3_14970 [Sphingomonas floccifaciens]|uniref:Secreted protein n=1 Tax=Sphingomonas floccifaciens TaxID=1844115 RepID=A0ABW4NFG7_9SPHN
MRNALICATTMLALLLLWPVVFGGGAASSAAASTVTIPIPPRVYPSSLRALPKIAPATESCGATRLRAAKACQPGNEACTHAVADAFDVCEAKGMWPS